MTAPGLLMIMAETQLAAAEVSKRDVSWGGRSTVLASVKLPEFDGNLRTTTRTYRGWRKSVWTIWELY